MKRFGVSNYQIQNVKQNWSNLMINTKKVINDRTDQLKEQLTASVGESLEEWMVKANESLISLNRWLKNREKELEAELKEEEKKDQDQVEKSIH
jgi:hypothetical protein